ncbi:MAG: MmcQ/YjbR family DNA-binding protein [Chloroflexota bacterium]
MIDRQTLRAYCASRKGAVEDYPFGPDTLVFKVMGKIFALMPVNPPPVDGPIGSEPGAIPLRINLKCDPKLAQILRETYPSVRPGYHMNKRHWNTVIIDGTISDDEIFEMIDNSYMLVVSGLKKADRDRLNVL